MAETLRSAMEAIPEASWTDSDGTELTSEQVIDEWPQDRLQEPVTFGEDSFGMTTIIGQNGDTILTMLQASGSDIESEPAVAPEE